MHACTSTVHTHKDVRRTLKPEGLLHVLYPIGSRPSPLKSLGRGGESISAVPQSRTSVRNVYAQQYMQCYIGDVPTRLSQPAKAAKGVPVFSQGPSPRRTISFFFVVSVMLALLHTHTSYLK